MIEPRWLTYTKAIVFTSPAVVVWGFACIFLVPKVDEIFLTAGFDTSRLGRLWSATFFLVHWGRSIFVAGILALALLEFAVPGWRCRRQLTVSISMWLANVTVLFGLSMLLIIVLMAAPSLAHR